MSDAREAGRDIARNFPELQSHRAFALVIMIEEAIKKAVKAATATEVKIAQNPVDRVI